MSSPFFAIKTNYVANMCDTMIIIIIIINEPFGVKCSKSVAVGGDVSSVSKLVWTKQTRTSIYCFPKIYFRLCHSAVLLLYSLQPYNWFVNLNKFGIRYSYFTLYCKFFFINNGKTFNLHSTFAPIEARLKIAR